MATNLLRLVSLACAGLVGAGAASSVARADLLASLSSGPPAEVSLIAGWRQADGSHVAAIEIRMRPGWYTYWRVPGDAGIAPEFDWSGSRNLASVAYEWPHPEVIETAGMRSFGFYDELVLPIRLEPQRRGEAIEASLELFFGICEQVCIPAEVRVEAVLPPSAAPVGRDRIGAAQAARAHGPGEAGVINASCGITAGTDGAEIAATVEFAAPPLAGQVVVFESARGDVGIGRSRTQQSGSTLAARAALAGGGALDRSDLRLTVIGPERTVDIPGCAPG